MRGAGVPDGRPVGGLGAAVAVVAVGALLAVTGATGYAGTAATHQAVLVDTTTTTGPVTTTTVPPTTTTSSTTTTTTKPTTTTSSRTSWILIAVIVILVLAIVMVILLMVSRRKKAALGTWRRRTLPALSDAKLAREALLSPSAVDDDAELRAAVAVQVERASTALEAAGVSAPEPAAGGAATTAAGALRGLAFAIEADRLLRHGAGAPTGVQLAQADQARRDRDGELQGALARLQTQVVPPTGRG